MHKSEKRTMPLYREKMLIGGKLCERRVGEIVVGMSFYLDYTLKRSKRNMKRE